MGKFPLRPRRLIVLTSTVQLSKNGGETACRGVLINDRSLKIIINYFGKIRQGLTISDLLPSLLSSNLLDEELFF